MDVGFKHVVGKSTLKEGFAVPREFEHWVMAPPKGSSRIIQLVFDGQMISASLRSINNGGCSVQIKYENQQGEPFRSWLDRMFVHEGTTSGYFEICRVDADIFQVIPYTQTDASVPSLYIEQWLFHKDADKMMGQDTPLAEIPEVVHSVPFEHDEGQSFYNKSFADNFKLWSWQSEYRVIQELGLKCDFIKDSVQVEVEFGNARTYYQDFVKFLLGNRYRDVTLGVLLLPSGAFARHLCEIGRQRAVQKGRGAYSGMIDFDKVKREFSYLDFMLPMPIAIASISSTQI